MNPAEDPKTKSTVGVLTQMFKNEDSNDDGYLTRSEFGKFLVTIAKISGEKQSISEY